MRTKRGWLWIILAGFIGAAASARGRSGIGWALLSLLLSPILAGLLLLLFPSITSAPATAHTRRCSHCAEPIMFEAKVCPHCRLAVPAYDPALLAQFPEFTTVTVIAANEMVQYYC